MLPPLLLWITISHQFVCLPTLELITFEQQVCSTKIGYTNALSLGRNSRKKKECDHFEQRTSSKKSSATLTVVCLNYWRKVWRKVYSRTIIKLIPLLQPEHGFYSTGWTFPSTRLLSAWKNGRGSRLLT